MRLREILETVEFDTLRGDLGQEIKGIVYDSRQAFPGCLFVCIEGLVSDGHNFAAHAVRNGAIAVIARHEIDIPMDVAFIKVGDSRKALAAASANFYDHPAEKMKIIGLTGTNGKTSTSFLIEGILKKAGFKTGIVGTISYKIGSKVRQSKNTTPESLDLQNYMAQMAELKTHYCVMEVSSHALALERVYGIPFDLGVFTNFTQDHLDFHKTLDEYFQAKLKLFQRLHPRGDKFPHAVLNLDDSRCQEILMHLKVPAVTYGIESAADVRATDIRLRQDGVEYKCLIKDEVIPVKINLAGVFNVYNSLAAIASACTQGIDLKLIKEALADFKGVKGRFELVRAGQNFAVIVDYAHTPDGIQNILESARDITKGRIIVVFGCGGDRDKTKRPVMGHIASELADICIITSDNPRSEVPEKIIEEIEAGVKKGKNKYEKITGRKEAIGRALYLAGAGDTVVIAGKGHENYQIFKDKTIHFDDVEVAEEFLKSMMSCKGAK